MVIFCENRTKKKQEYRGNIKKKIKHLKTANRLGSKSFTHYYSLTKKIFKILKISVSVLHAYIFSRYRPPTMDYSACIYNVLTFLIKITHIY